jgi:hypothetical protein
MTTATAPAISREIFQDRIEGLLWQPDTSTDSDREPTALGASLYDALTELVYRSARVHPDLTSDLVDEILTAAKVRIVDAIAAGELDDEPTRKAWAA